MTTVLQDLRFAGRTLARNPGFTLVAVLTLALGIGVNTAIFSVVDATLLRPLPLIGPERLVAIQSVTPEGGLASVTYADHLDWREQRDVFASVAVYRTSAVNLAGEGEAERVVGGVVSEDFFTVLSARPLLGRTFTPEELQVRELRVAVLSEGLWRRRFAGDRQIVGKTIRVNGSTVTVVGVMPGNGRWPLDAELWAPIPLGTIEHRDLMRRDNYVWQSIARLRPDVSIDHARARVAAIAQRVAREHAEVGPGWSATAIPLTHWLFDAGTRRALFVLFGAVGFVLLIACLNTANLLLARATGRGRELALRAALGAGRIRLVRQLMTESVLLALVGGGAGVALALWGTKALVALAPPGLARIEEVGVDGGVLVFAVAVSLLTALLFGLLPALQASRGAARDGLTDGGLRASHGTRARLTQRALVVGEIALSLVLLIGAGLMLKSLARLQRVDPGLRTEGVVSMGLTVPTGSYPTDSRQAAFYTELLREIQALPGVRSAGLTSALPIGGGGVYLGRAFLVEGQPEPPQAPEHLGQWNVISPGAFRALGIPLLRGRDFTAQDDSGSTPVAIVSRTMARQLFGDANPIGRRFRSWRDENVLREVVGVAGDVRYYGLDSPLEPIAFVPHTQDAWGTMFLLVRTEGDPARIVSSIRRRLAELDPDVPLADVRTLTQVRNDSVAADRGATVLLGTFGGLALVMAAVGLYGVISYSVAQRRREIGIRVALGAESADVRRLVIGEALPVVLAGIALGVAGALLLSRVLAALLYQVSATDPVTFAALSAALALVALLASWIPARRAARLDPLVALRYE